MPDPLLHPTPYNDCHYSTTIIITIAIAITITITIPVYNGYISLTMVVLFSVYVTSDYIPAVSGIGSVCLWLFALLPQLYLNYRRKRCESLSWWFICLWLTGDIFSCVGLLLLGQRTTAVILGVYFCCNDVLLLMQMYCYRESRHHSTKYNHSSISNNDSHNATDGTAATTRNKALYALLLLSGAVLALTNVGLEIESSASYTASNKSPAILANRQGRILLADLTADQPSLCNSRAARSDLSLTLGSICGWIAAIICPSARLPQLVQNYRRKSMVGLSLGLFILAALGNVLFFMQFITENWIRVARGHPFSWGTFFAKDMPFIIGSLGPATCDSLIIYQFFLYRHNDRKIIVEPGLCEAVTVHSASSSTSSAADIADAGSAVQMSQAGVPVVTLSHQQHTE